MTEDLDPLLRKWPYETGSVQARLITGVDGRPRLQMRVDLGILQLELEGRPDGRTVFGCESLLEHYEKLAVRTEDEGKSASFKLTMDDCIKLQQEGVQYYHRYLALFQLQQFTTVIRDTERNLRMFDFVARYAEKPEISAMFQQFRPYVLMMLTRARGMLALQEQDYALAIKHIEWGIREIRGFLQEHYPPEVLEQNHEIHFLQDWLKEIQAQRPLTPREKLQRQMDEAVQKEDYERAARLRDALRALD